MTIREDQTHRVTGESGTYGVVDKPDFALVVPWDGERFHLVEQFRYPISRRCWEFPQGSWPTPGNLDDPSDLARAELREETGLTAGSLTLLGYLHEASGYCTSGFHVWLATRLAGGSQQLEPTEADLVTASFTADELWGLVARGQLTDAPTLAALALFTHHNSTD